MDKSVSSLNSQLENISLNLISTQQLNNTLTNKSLKNVKTPIKSSLNYTPNNKKTPSRHRNNKENFHSNRKKSPKEDSDRFIPNRSNINFEISHYLMNNTEASLSNESNKSTTISELVGDLSTYRIISYQNKAPLQPEGHVNDTKVVYSSTKSSKVKAGRYISKQPERILDCPDIRNDYYLQLLDWSNYNMLAVSLNSEVYLWDASNGNIIQLLSLEEPDYISSVSWSENSAHHLAVGLSTGVTQIWDVNKNIRVRSLANSDSRISCLSWSSYILSNGSKDASIYNHDVRVASSLVGTLQGHSLEICGLKWSHNGRFLASGGNDNLINIWPNCYMGQIQSSSVEPLFQLTNHQAAVKALSWCPWRSNCLASGGGTNDRMIRIWNTQNGQCTYSVDTRSQVSSILWSQEYRELISAHGYLNNELIIWKYPSFTKVAELTGHSARILGMAMSADGTTVVSLGADETLRFWDCFAVDSEKKKMKQINDSKKDSKNGALKFKMDAYIR